MTMRTDARVVFRSFKGTTDVANFRRVALALIVVVPSRESAAVECGKECGSSEPSHSEALDSDIGCHECQTFDLRLCDEQSVERIPMRNLQQASSADMRHRNG